MQKLEVFGANKLRGHVKISGSKNASLPILAATLLSNKKIYLVPKIKIDHYGGKSHNQNIEKEMELSRNWHWMWSSFNYHRKYRGFLFSFSIMIPKLFSAFIKTIFYTLILNKNKKEIYYHRFLGLINAMIGKTSWYRPNV